MNDGTEYQVPTVGARSKYTLLIFASKKAMRLAGTRQYLSIIRPIMKKNPSKSYDFDGFCHVLIKKMQVSNPCSAMVSGPPCFFASFFWKNTLGNANPLPCQCLIHCGNFLAKKSREC